MTSSCRSSLLPLGKFAQAGFVNSPAGRKAGLLGTAFGFGPDDPRLYVDVRVDVCVDGCVDVWSLCVDLYVDLCVDVCLLSRRFGVAFSLIRFGVPHEINEAHQKKYQLFEKT